MNDGEMEEAMNAARIVSLIRIAQFGPPSSMAAFYYLAEEQMQRQKEATGVTDNKTNTDEPVNDPIDWFDCNVFQCEGLLSCCGGQEFVNEN